MTGLFLQDEKEIPIAFDIITQFGYLAGLILNIEKTAAMWLGSYKH